MNAFMIVCILFESTYTRLRFSNISSIVWYLQEEFLFNLAKICLYVSSFNLILTYVIVIFFVKYQFLLTSSLLRIADNQCLNLFLSSIKIVKSSIIAERFVFAKWFVALVFVVILARVSNALYEKNDDSSIFRACSFDFSIFKFFICFLNDRMNDFRSLLSFFNASVFFMKLSFSFWYFFSKSHCSLYSLISSRFFSRVVLIISRSRFEKFFIQNCSSFMISM
jgi:hypothetical protein